jgi:replication-associated recombination protein RarA
MKMKRPTEYLPSLPVDFIGKTRRIAEIVHKRMLEPWTTLKWIFTGPPGTGKSRLAEVSSLALAGSPFTVDRVNGQSLTIEVVRRWREMAQYKPLFGRSVKVVEEIDAASTAAQNELRTYLDELKDGAFVATTNKPMKELQPQLSSRCAHFKFDMIPNDDIRRLLTCWVPAEIAASIALGSNGCVRSALIDAELWMDAQ